ncbi:MAG: DUF1492 domain-containing protein [Ruminococcus sp.]|nr:DUF1492 domain-containing protein [Ruminococcus sp.]MCI5617918.1 DUF1492 domain-containing protein [Ruminococcus sp.]
MNAKEYLNRVRLTDISINTKSDELYHLKLKSLQVSPQSQGERVQSSCSGGDFTKIIDRIVLLQDKINEEIDLLVELKEQARTLIHMLTDERYKTVLTEYYLNHKTWEQVADCMNYDLRWVYRIHGKALKEFSKVLNSH